MDQEEADDRGSAAGVSCYSVEYPNNAMFFSAGRAPPRTRI